MLVGDVAASDADQASREITVLADKSLPYEVVKKVMATCTAATYGKISLASWRGSSRPGRQPEAGLEAEST